MKLLSRLTARESADQQRMSWDEYLAWVNQVYGGRPMTTFTREMEPVASDFEGNASLTLGRNGPIFALVGWRMSLFSQVRWVFQAFSKGRPGDLFGTPALDILNDDPSFNKWAILDNDLAGNFYGLNEFAAFRNERRITRLRPDWVQVASDRPLGDPMARVRGYFYFDGGINGKSLEDAKFFRASEVIHWYDRPDPLAKWRGMSWITPVAREIAADNASTTHKLKFFENAATPNLVFKFDAATSPANVKEFKELVESENRGAQNAYRDLYLGGGADVTVVGSDLKQLEFTMTQGKGESRLASAAGVPAVLVGFSEGLQAATYSNFSQARRAAADSTLHPLWVSAAGAFAKALEVPSGARLWYDSRDIPFLREDAKDDAEIKAREAATIRQLVDAGYTPESVVAAVQAGDWAQLVHTNLFSVQLQPPGVQPPAEEKPVREMRFLFDDDGRYAGIEERAR